MLQRAGKITFLFGIVLTVLFFYAHAEAKVDLFSYTDLSDNSQSGTLSVNSDRMVLCGTNSPCNYGAVVGLSIVAQVPQFQSDGTIKIGPTAFHPDGSITGPGGASFYIDGLAAAGKGGLHSHADEETLTPAPEEPPLTADQLAKLQVYASQNHFVGLPFPLVWSALIAPDNVHLYRETLDASIVGTFVPCAFADNQCGGNPGFSVCGVGSWGFNQCELVDTGSGLNTSGNSGRYGLGLLRDYGGNGSGEVKVENLDAVVYGAPSLQQSIGLLFQRVAFKLVSDCGCNPQNLNDCPFNHQPPQPPPSQACFAPLDISGTLLVRFPAIEGTVVVKWDEGKNP